ncbi:hypothetical protein FC56_GL000455 [Lentilactobacillus senioris DSM 24302 = JCM 17472]|uniref:UPF0291 protein FC56_GL000455 n=2 Tax=Lentilactobacillus senioris TaxID=931534 RepID=A0A0R2D004_9LACO|nr:hypothetical protein FC56_GL000455 [Lentilactobacillus senioris DSM 24302 = JCM 17472]
MAEDKKENKLDQIEDEVMKQIVPRINELAKKAKAEGLTELEKVEQKDLRDKYVKRFRENFKSQIEMMKIYDKEGKEVTSDKVKDIQREKGLRDD